MKIETAKQLEVYQIAYRLAMDIFELTKKFPPEERWALTGQIRRPKQAILCATKSSAQPSRSGVPRFVFLSKLADFSVDSF